MSVYDYICKLQAADSLEELNQVVEEAANDDYLTNEEYERVYKTALMCA